MDVDLGQDLAARISGSRFSMLQGPVARLHRALGQMMMDQHARTGYQEVVPPTIVRSDALYGTGQLPKFEDDLYGLVNQQDEDVCGLYLIPTAEVSLTNIHAGRLEVILEGTKFSTHRYVALTECYRAEAGSAGRDTRGLIRQHQFQKVEMVVVCDPQDAQAEHQRMLEGAENILRALQLPYRRVLLCRGDMGFSARKTYDLEVWMPGQNAYREISSISDCGDFQARRMDSRFKRGKEILFPHTLNGSGVAVGRALAAVLENHQTQDGDVLIPEALRPYMLGATLLSQLN
jgi:seryl-tRNA synthetase